ncbi:flagellar basal body P-ring formation chaperone FlgA [Acerihabitans sp. TG2]|uniref:flagellar basal body P-ring formation chaperone FlgA n=1 Tax=Acerihabitans sp. TG2 TaxID=3096008 RepID=UPI002B22F369|nr:flagellar basal body P-ring formation chaperone FlgA [Acerihabitans sp. TG2]MEA9392608.1 flagellar basal body P-ring formation chaperone FlgA [Acerihabitans sp. TG2]
MRFGSAKVSARYLRNIKDEDGGVRKSIVTNANLGNACGWFHQCGSRAGHWLSTMLVNLGGYRALAGSLLLLSAAAAADPLTQQLTDFMQQQYPTAPKSLLVVIKTPLNRQLHCEHPQFSLPSRNRIWGMLSIAMVCNGNKRYLQADVQVTDRYLVAARFIGAHQMLTEQDIAWRTGRLDMLNTLPLNDMSLALGSVSERTLGSGQPLTSAMLRRAWLVKTGQMVRVTAQGDGFSVQSTGKAMNNAAINDQIRVRLDSGQIVNGQLMANGDVDVVF